jgi:transposase
VSLAFCWAHVRRRFYELAQSGPRQSPRRRSSASPNSTRSRARYGDVSPEERRTARQERSRPVIDALQPWLREKLALISQKSKLAEAIRYTLSRWAGLGRFLDDGRVEIDSNVVERSIRPIALNRKNALFAGSDGGGEHWATIASLIETCEAQRRRPVRLPRRRHHPHRRRPSAKPARRPAALGLCPRATQGRGLRTAL